MGAGADPHARALLYQLQHDLSPSRLSERTYREAQEADARRGVTLPRAWPASSSTPIAAASSAVRRCRLASAVATTSGPNAGPPQRVDWNVAAATCAPCSGATALSARSQRGGACPAPPKVFRRHYGHSPREYRRLHRGRHQQHRTDSPLSCGSLIHLLTRSVPACTSTRRRQASDAAAVMKTKARSAEEVPNQC